MITFLFSLVAAVVRCRVTMIRRRNGSVRSPRARHPTILLLPSRHRTSTGFSDRGSTPVDGRKLTPSRESAASRSPRFGGS